MKSLRARLTLSYAVFAAVVLGLVSLLACRIAFEFVARGTLDALSLSVARAESAGQGPGSDRRDVVARAVTAAAAPGVVVFAPSLGGGPGIGGLARGSQHHGDPRDRPPPGLGPDEDHPPPPDGFDFRAQAGGIADSPFVRTVVAPFLGLTMRTVFIRGRKIVIAPDFHSLEAVLRQFTWLFAGSLAVSIVLAWAIASWLAGAAIEPLVALTHELERFAAGDFTTRLVSTSEGGELGALIAAYNGAAAQVTSAFRERREVELHTRRFLADAGHELRTPLTVIRGYLEILRKGGIDDPVVRQRAVAMLTTEAQRMRVLIDRLLTLARLERPDVAEHTEVNVEEIAAAAIAHVRAARGGDIALSCPAAVFVLADPAELAEAIENVVDNAVKYGRRSAVAVRVETHNDHAVIRINDGGGGIPESERDRLFERFFRGDDRGEIEGSGLGLAIAQRAVARCGGQIVLEDSRPGETTFRITLPTATTRAGAIEPLHL